MRAPRLGRGSAGSGSWLLVRLLAGARESFWFVPTLTALLASGLAVVLVVWQKPIDGALAGVVPWLFQGEPDSARTVLTAIAGSMATTAGTTFSVTVVALTLASRQFGPRVLRGFLRDRIDQLTIGAFIGTFLYALIVLRCIRNAADGVPNAAVSAGFLLAVASMALLIAFIHHVAASIQVSSILEGIVADTLAEIPAAFPAPIGEGARPELAPDVPADSRPVRSVEHGYVQAVDAGALLRVVERADLVVHLCVKPGDFVPPGGLLARAGPPARCDAATEGALRDAVLLGARPTLAGNPGYGFSLISDIAVKALREEADPTTALHCVDASGVLLARLLDRRRPSDLRRGDDGVVRVVTRGRGFRALLEAAFEPIRSHSVDEPDVLTRLLGTLRELHDQAGGDDRRAALRRMARRVAETGGGRHPDEDARLVEAARWISAVEAGG